jgi:hypothetical protein
MATTPTEEDPVSGLCWPSAPHHVPRCGTPFRSMGLVSLPPLLPRSRMSDVDQALADECPRLGFRIRSYGGVAEWFKAPVLKTVERASAPWVRIPPPPPNPRIGIA